MFRPKLLRAALFWFFVCALTILATATTVTAWADEGVPRAALKYRAGLTRTAHSAWGLDAPVAVFAAQIHQESGWHPQAFNSIGAQGLGQFMPDTAQWWCNLHHLSETACQPANPVWAMRAMVGYDRWLFKQVNGPTEYDRMWAALRSYNGGLGHWQAEMRLAGHPQEAASVRPAVDRLTVDSVCGAAHRSEEFCPENLGYPRRILVDLQPRYLGWGRGVAP